MSVAARKTSYRSWSQQFQCWKVSVTETDRMPALPRGQDESSPPQLAGAWRKPSEPVGLGSGVRQRIPNRQDDDV